MHGRNIGVASLAAAVPTPLYTECGVYSLIVGYTNV